MLRREHFRIIRNLGFSEPDYILGDKHRPASFELPAPGIYTLEGPNQSGKSLLIKLLSGALPRSIRVSDETLTTIRFDPRAAQFEPIGERKVRIATVREAMGYGIYAVHQNDDLLPTLTVREHILLRHLTPGLRSYAHLIADYGAHPLFPSLIAKLGPTTDRLFHWWESLDPRKPRVIEQRARDEIARFTKEDILDKYPWELSGGARAIVRLVSIRLYDKVKILLLDEVFNAVDRDTWPKMMASIRNWQKEADCALLVVSHNTEELLRWQPDARFRLQDRQIHQIGLNRYHSIHIGIPARRRTFALFVPQSHGTEERHYAAPWFWQKGDRGTFFVISSAQLLEAKPTHRLVSFLKNEGFAVRELTVRISEKEKAVSNFRDLVDQVLGAIVEIAEREEPPLFAFCIIGGGTILNTLGFVTGTMYRGRIPVVWVPTTLTAIADVGIGSKTSLNWIGAKNIKNVIGTYSNPAAVVVDTDYLAHLQKKERLDGLAECFKHGLLQSERLYRDVIAALRNHDDIDELADIAIKTMMMKSEVLSRFPFETGPGRILRYGHIHAHALEQATDFAISHTSAVFWGALLELRLGGTADLLHDVLDNLGPVLRSHHQAWINVPMDILLAAYRADIVDSINNYKPVMISKVGEYGNPISETISEGPEIGLLDVEREIHQLRGMIIRK